jgi:hypothetical protein
MPPYVPLNINVFQAAFTGAMAAMSSPATSAIIDPISNDYLDFCHAAVSWAQAVDQAWATAGAPAPNSFDVDCILQTSTLYHENHHVAPHALSTFQNVSNWAIPAAACVAVVLEGDANLAALGITPGQAGGNLLRVRGVTTDWVDINHFAVNDIGGLNDGIDYVQGDLVLLFNQNFQGMTPKNPEQNGPWVVGPVTGGFAVLSRPGVWFNGTILFTDGIEIRTGSEGTVYKNTTWYAMGPQAPDGQVGALTVANTFIVGTDDPGVYPLHVGVSLDLLAGEASIFLPIYSPITSVSIVPVSTSGNAATVKYLVDLLPGNLLISELDVTAVDAAGAININEDGTILLGIYNQGLVLRQPT